jgi:hypothetical protein
MMNLEVSVLPEPDSPLNHTMQKFVSMQHTKISPGCCTVSCSEPDDDAMILPKRYHIGVGFVGLKG